MLTEREMAGLVDDVEERPALVPCEQVVQLAPPLDHRRAIVEAPDHLYRTLQPSLVDPLQGLALLACELGEEQLAAELLRAHLAHALLVLWQRERVHDRIHPLLCDD